MKRLGVFRLKPDRGAGKHGAVTRGLSGVLGFLGKQPHRWTKVAGSASHVPRIGGEPLNGLTQFRAETRRPSGNHPRCCWPEPG